MCVYVFVVCVYMYMCIFICIAIYNIYKINMFSDRMYYVCVL